MSAQQLSPRSCRRVARATGQEVLRGWSHGGYVLGFVTPDHRHGWYDKKSGEWGWEDASDVLFSHYTSCSETWPEEMELVRERKFQTLRKMQAADQARASLRTRRAPVPGAQPT